ncbi:MAG: D-2-hydroxyacid dehydrogenase [Bryobacteraceae bacterium]|nr:D-2-hydroxyacid dehydrogenase [Bryobacteraceae bacterium]MDW8380145.1 D-2-hydroxyacid dehydrogenase [Bryobacterales bacterium]
MRSFVLVLLLSSWDLCAQTKKILAWNMSPADVRELQAVTDKARIVPVNANNVMQEIADADAFLGEITPQLVRAGKKLQWVQTRSAGVERVLHLSGSNDLRDSNIILTNNQIVQGPEIADHAMAMLLSLTRNIPGFIEMRKSGKWVARRESLLELNGNTAIIIGCGGIGMQIAVRAWAHGMKNICVDPEDLPYSPFVVRTVKPDQLDEVVPEADVIFVAAPHTPQSHKMMGPRQFEKMKRGSFFIAVSRGALYDLNALVRALDSKQLAGAGVDVTDPEPLPEGHPLWKFDNAIITPHIAGRSDKDAARMMSTIKENIRRFVNGQPLLNVVDKHKGY